MADCPPATHTTNHGTGFPFKHPISPAGELKPRPCSKGVQLRQLEQTIRTFLNKMPDRSQAGKCWCSCHTLQGWQSSSVALQPWCKHRHCCNPCGRSVLWFYTFSSQAMALCLRLGSMAHNLLWQAEGRNGSLGKLADTPLLEVGRQLLRRFVKINVAQTEHPVASLQIKAHF